MAICLGIGHLQVFIWGDFFVGGGGGGWGGGGCLFGVTFKTDFVGGWRGGWVGYCKNRG